MNGTALTLPTPVASALAVDTAMAVPPAPRHRTEPYESTQDGES